VLAGCFQIIEFSSKKLWFFYTKPPCSDDFLALLQQFIFNFLKKMIENSKKNAKILEKFIKLLKPQN